MSKKHKRGQGEGSIYKTKDGQWRAAISLGWARNDAGAPVWRRKFITAPTRYDVQRKLTKILRDRELGLPIISEKQTVGQFLQHWLAEVAKPQVKPKTFRSYSDLVRLHIAPAIGDKPLAKLTPAHIRQFLNDKLTTPQPSRKKPQEGEPPEAGAPLSARSVKHLLVTLRGALEVATKDGILPRNVAALVDPPRVIKPQMKAFDAEQARTFLAALKGDRLEALFTTAISLGCRQGEALGFSGRK